MLRFNFNSLIALVVAVFGLVASAARAQEANLLFATANPPSTDVNTHLMHPWAERINEQGKGILHIDVRDGATIANLSNGYDRVMSDVVQLAFVLHGGTTGVFPRTAVAGLPSFTQTSDIASVALWRLYETPLLQQEYEQIVPLVMIVFPPGRMHFRAPISFPAALRGLKIITAGKYQGELLESFGAAPITLLPSDYYGALQRGGADRVASAWTTFQPFKLYEVTHYHVEVSTGRGTGMIFMKKSRFLALPAAARKILEENSGEGASLAFGRFWQSEQDSWRDRVNDMKEQQIVAPTADAATTWRAHAAAFDRAWTDATPDGAQVLSRYRSIVLALAAAH
jgi:TRAP-type C4-dicarboxylate transport system substrate-binding protein